LHTSQPTPPKEAVNLFASISGDEFRAGISGAVEGECRLPDLPAKPEWRVSIISEGGDGTGTLAIMTIEIKGDRLS
jgi:hypothetical protein